MGEPVFLRAIDHLEYRKPTGELALAMALNTKIDTNGCHIWNGQFDDSKGPVFRNHDRLFAELGKTHINVRRALFLAKGRQIVFSTSCGNSKCVNPEHISICRTMRAPFKQPRLKTENGSRYATVLDDLKLKAAIELHQCGWAGSKIAKVLSVSQSTISRNISAFIKEKFKP